MKYNNTKFREFWYSLDTAERKVIADKAGKHPVHIEQVAQGNRKLHSSTAFPLMEADSRITLKMCFPEKFK